MVQKKFSIFCWKYDYWVNTKPVVSFDEFQKKGIDPNISGKKSLAQSNIRISSYRRFKMSAYGK